MGPPREPRTKERPSSRRCGSTSRRRSDGDLVFTRNVSKVHRGTAVARVERGSTVQGVDVRLAEQPVVAFPAPQAVVAVIAEQAVDAWSAAQQIVAAIAEQHVVAGKAADQIR